MDEQGTKAAAVTATIFEEAAEPGIDIDIKFFIANHPFLFFILDTNTNAILFMGKFVEGKPYIEEKPYRVNSLENSNDSAFNFDNILFDDFPDDFNDMYIKPV